MINRNDLESKLQKLDVSSLSDEQAQLLLNTLSTITSPVSKRQSFIETKPEEKIDSSVFLQILELNPFAIGISDLDGRMLLANKALVDLFGSLPPKEYSIFKDRILIEAGFEAELEKARNGEMVRIPELLYNPAKYHPKTLSKESWTRSVIFPIFDEKGKILNFILIHEDITEKKKAEIALVNSEEKNKLIFENIQAVYYEAAIDGNLVEMSPSVEKFTKYTRAELIGANVFDIYYDIKDREKLMRDIAKTNFLLDYPMIVKDKDGSKIYCSLNCRLVKDGKGNPLKIVGAIINMTALHHSHEELKKSEERFRELYENANDIIWTSDLEGNFISMNPVAEKILGYKLEEEVCPNMKKYLTPKSYEVAMEHIKNKISSVNNHSEYEVEVIAKNGNTVFLELSTFLKYKNDKPVGIFGIGRDITDRKKTEEELNKTREKYKELFEGTNDIVYTMDFEGNFTSVNPMVEKMLGVKFEEITKFNMRDYITPESAIHAFENIEKKLKGEKTNTVYTIDFVNKDGSYTSLEVNSMISYRNRTPFEIFGIARDITDRLKTEAELNKTRERYKELFETSNDVIYTMDFKGTITSVNPMAQKMLGYNFEDLSEPNMKDYVTPETLKLAFENITAKLNGDKSHSVYKADFRKSDGTFITFEINSQLRYKDGIPIEIFGIARDITPREIAEEKEKLYNQHISTLMKSANKFVELSPDENIWNAIAEYLSQLTCSKFLIVDSYNKEKNELRSEVFYTDKKTQNQVTKLIGRKVAGMVFNPTEKILSELKSKNIVKISGGLYEFSGKMIPQSICTAVEKIFNIGSIYGMGFSINDEIFGSASLILKEGEVIEDENILKTYMHQVSTVLQRRHAEIELKRNEEKYRTIFENAPLGIMTADTGGNIVEINPTLLQVLGSKSIEETRNINVLKFKPLADAGFVDAFQRCIKTGNAVITEGVYTSKWNKTFDARIYTKPLREENDKVSGIQVIVEDITEEKLAERKIKAALAEKEVLLREIHHRVKNNMQIIISLINMQMQESDDLLIIRKFKELQQRVRTMSIIHEDLYISENLSKINFGNYLHRLANNLLQIYPHNSEIDLKFDVSDVYLGIDAAIPCGLIVNELLSNSFKHAFPAEWVDKQVSKKLKIIVEFKCKGNKCFLSVGDNGVGMPSIEEAQERNTLGLVLVEVLVNQLKGTLKMSNNRGTRYEIELERDIK